MINALIDSAGVLNPVQLSPSFADGAMGTVHHIQGRTGVVAKLYKSAADRPKYEPKLQSMINSSPDLPDIVVSGRRYVQIAWPTHSLFAPSGEFIGFVMPEVDFKRSRMLDLVMRARDRQSSGISEFYGFRVFLAANLAAVMAALHARGHYMIDMKPENLRFYPDQGSMAVIDTDGFSIAGIRTRIPAEQYSDDYIAPEAKGLAPSALGEPQDLFALAVLIFRMLNNGIHPYQGTSKVAKALPTSQQERIFSKLYAYGLVGNRQTGPSPSSIHAYFDDDTRALFDRAFVSGGSRPSAADWRDHLRDLCSNSRLVRCAKKPAEHAHFTQGCGLCAQDNLRSAAVQAANLVQPPSSGSIQQTTSQHPSFQPSSGSTVTGPGTSQSATGATTHIHARGTKKFPRAAIAAAAVFGVCAAGWALSNAFGDHKPPYPISQFSNPMQENVTAIGLNVRKGPGTAFPVTDHLSKGDLVTGIGSVSGITGGTWQYIKLADGNYGFVNARLLTNVSEPTTVTPPQTDVATQQQPAPVTAPPPPAPSPVESPQQPAVTEPVSAPAQDENQRVHQIISAANFYHDQSPDSGEIPGRSFVMRVDVTYANAQAGDVAQGAVAMNGQLVGRCNVVPLQVPSGNFWCRIPVYAPGQYQFIVGVNRIPVVGREFDVPAGAGSAAPSPQVTTTQQPQRRIVGTARVGVFNPLHDRHRQDR